jgi:hypothetical protein
VDVSANCIAYVQDSIKILQNKGYQVNFAKPCSVYMCLDVRNSSGDSVLTINIEVQSNKTCRLIYNVTGLRIPGAPRATQHFTTLLEKLIKRAGYRANSPPWAIFAVSGDKFKEYRIAWQEIAKYIEATHLPVTINISMCGAMKQKLLIPIQKVYFIVEEDPLRALKMLIYMNSDLARNLVKLWAWTTRGGYYEHTSYNIGILPLPRDLVDNKLWGFLEDLLKQQKENIDLNEIAKNASKTDMEKELMQILGLDEEEYRELVEYGKWLNELGKAPEADEETMEEEYVEG